MLGGHAYLVCANDCLMVRRWMNASPSARAFRSFVIFLPMPNGLQMVRLCFTTAAPSRSASKSKRSRTRFGIVELLHQRIALLGKIRNQIVENLNRNRGLLQVVNVFGFKRILVCICEVGEKGYESFEVWIDHNVYYTIKYQACQAISSQLWITIYLKSDLEPVRSIKL